MFVFVFLCVEELTSRYSFFRCEDVRLKFIDKDLTLNQRRHVYFSRTPRHTHTYTLTEAETIKSTPFKEFKL